MLTANSTNPNQYPKSNYTNPITPTKYWWFGNGTRNGWNRKLNTQAHKVVFKFKLYYCAKFLDKPHGIPNPKHFIAIETDKNDLRRGKYRWSYSSKIFNFERSQLCFDHYLQFQPLTSAFYLHGSCMTTVSKERSICRWAISSAVWSPSR